MSASMPLLMQHFMPRVDFSEIGPTLETALTKIGDSALKISGERRWQLGNAPLLFF
jgi:hypothetical protein